MINEEGSESKSASGSVPIHTPGPSLKCHTHQHLNNHTYSFAIEYHAPSLDLEYHTYNSLEDHASSPENQTVCLENHTPSLEDHTPSFKDHAPSLEDHTPNTEPPGHGEQNAVSERAGMALLERSFCHPDFICGSKPSGLAMLAVVHVTK